MIDLNKIAIIAGERNVTYSQMLACVSRFAKKTPVGRGTKTVILGENSEQWVYAFFSVWQNEGIAVPVDASSTASDVAYILSDCRPDAVWVSKDKEPVLKEALELMGKEQGSQPAGNFAPKVLRLDGVTRRKKAHSSPGRPSPNRTTRRQPSSSTPRARQAPPRA